MAPRRTDSTGWTIEVLREHFQRQLDDLRVLLDERYATQTKALDAAFASQQIATQTAIQSQERAVQTAMDASDKAVAKAEVAAEKRFEALNEFRGAVQDIVAQQMPRGEAETRFAALTEKIDELKTASAQRDGQGSGRQAATTERRLDAGSALQAIAVLLTVVGLLIVAFHR
jgi:cell pole-organizing protein PopZ